MYKVVTLDLAQTEEDMQIFTSYLNTMDLYKKGSTIIDYAAQKIFCNKTAEKFLTSCPAAFIEKFASCVRKSEEETTLSFSGYLDSSTKAYVEYWTRHIKQFSKDKIVLCVIEYMQVKDTNDPLPEIVGESKAIKAAKDKVIKVASNDSSVLLIGETGTGKEVFAHAIHKLSKRKDKNMVIINCGAIPDSLLESELFGYEEGAFTGARRSGKLGLLEQANGGTIFLDEIENMSAYMQNKLLRVLEDGSFQRLGGNRTININIRIIGATNIDLKTMVEEGTFRKDLYYRLNVISIRIPSLRERKGDIIKLSYHFIDQFNKTMHKSIRGLTSQVKDIFMAYPWEGNVRELKNTIEHAMNFEEGHYISVSSLPDHFMSFMDNTYKTAEAPLFKTLEELEKEAIEQALSYFGWDEKGKNLAAEALGISRSSIYRKIAKYFGTKS